MKILDKDTLLKVIRSGTMSRTYVALQNHPNGLTVEEIADICGLKPDNVYKNGVLQLFNAQLVRRTEEKGKGTIYYLLEDKEM